MTSPSDDRSGRARHRCPQDRGDPPRRLLHRRHLKRAPAGGPHRRDDPLRQAREGRRGHHLRADTPDSQPRARPGAAALSRPRHAGCSTGRAAGRARIDQLSPARRAIISCQILEESGLKAGLDFNAAFSPERVDPGRTDHTLRSTPQTHLAAAFLALAVVIGLTVAPLLALGIIVLYVIGLTMPGAWSPEV